MSNIEHDFESKTDILKLEEGPEVVSLRKCQLIFMDGPSKGKKLTLNKDRLTIGKRDNNDIVVTDKTVSRKHCEIVYEAEAFLLRDCESTNGTFLNGSKVKEAYLSPADVIKLGSTQLEFIVFDEKVSIEPSDKEEFGGMVGKSRKMRQIFAILEKISKTHASVIVEGETGTGKDLVAKAVHEHSTRRQKPFIVFDCTGVAPNLIESELFGHEKGAFTGAIRSRPGIFEAAKGGTVFLDELGELPLDLQPKLLRALENREVRRVGANEATRIDVRVVSATNRNLKQEIQDGKFREDLYYRMSVVKVLLPALRDRAEDIPLIVERLLTTQTYNKTQTGFKVIRVEDDALKLLQRYPWPGNVRELANVLERACSFVEGDTIRRNDLEFVFSEMDEAEERTENMRINTDVPFKEAKQEIVERFEKEYLEELLKKYNYNLSKAAREAKVDRKHIRNLLKKYGIETKF